MIKWHRLLGLTLTDFFEGSLYSVELEKDLSVKQQLIDVVIIEKKEGRPLSAVPDGLENLAGHNLLTYKSHQESLDSWCLDELTGHYVNYRKQISEPMLPSDNFRLYAVSTRFPKKLAEETTLNPLKQGIFEVLWGVKKIRIIVSGTVPETENNAVWLMFSANPDKINFGASHYQGNLNRISTVMDGLFMRYNLEGVHMPYTFEDLHKDIKQEIINSMTIDDFLKKFSADDLLKKLKPTDRLKGLSSKEILSGLNPDEIESYLKELKQTVH